MSTSTQHSKNNGGNSGGGNSTAISSASSSHSYLAAKPSGAAEELSEALAKTTMTSGGFAHALNVSNNNSSFASSPGQAGDAKIILGLKARIKELELSSISTEAERAKLAETTASQAKTIATQQATIKQLESDLEKVKSEYQQNNANVAVWKQQLGTYQEVNDSLSAKMTELAELYEKFGDILKRV